MAIRDEKSRVRKLVAAQRSFVFKFALDSRVILLNPSKDADGLRK
jgi:hypothetical protein